MSDRFEFGENWSKFIAQNLSEDIVAQSGTALRRFLGLPTLKNLSFLDVGSGSGLSSLAAWRAGATNVISFDVDPLAVQTTQKLRSYAGNPENWQIMQGDVLDAAFMRALPEFDIVYSWGVLHHTGHMREAVRNAAYPCRKRGLLALALYSYTAYANGLASGLPGPEEWLEIKRHYLHARKLRRRLMELGYLWRCHCAPARGNPRGVAKGLADIWRCWREYDNSGRGMSFWTDIRDWLGGWPMEFVHEDELCRQVCDGGEFSLVRMNTGEGNTEFLFRRSGADAGPGTGGTGWEKDRPDALCRTTRSFRVTLATLQARIRRYQRKKSEHLTSGLARGPGTGTGHCRRHCQPCFWHLLRCGSIVRTLPPTRRQTYF